MQKKIVYLLLLGIMGCSSSIPPPPSSTNLPKTTKSGIKITNSQEDISRIKWWQKLYDQKLNALISTALKNNNQLKTANANVLVAKAKLNEAHYAWLPTLNGAGYGFIGKGSDTQITPLGPLAQSPIFSQLNNIRFNAYTAGFMPQYSINILANINNTNYAKASLEAQKATYQATRLSVISQTVGAYFMLIGQKEQLKMQRKLIQDLKNLKNLEWIRYKAGESDLSQAIDLDIQIKNSEANISLLENSIAQDENAIAVLLGKNPEHIATSKTFMHMPTTNVIPKNLPSTVLKNRPDVMIASASLNMSKYQLGVAYASYFPKFSLTSNIGTMGLEFARLLSLNTNLLFLEAGASMPLLNGVTFEQIKEAKSGYYADFYSYLQTLIAAFADVDNSLTNQQKANQAYKDKIESLRHNKKAFALVMARYTAGTSDKRDVIKSQYNVDNAKLNLILARMQQLDSIVQVYQAVAGGYNSYIDVLLVS